jgi:hypothetical protein
MVNSTRDISNNCIILSQSASNQAITHSLLLPDQSLVSQLQQRIVEVDGVLRRQLAPVQLPPAFFGEVLGVELAGGLVVVAGLVPREQSQLLVDGGHQFRAEEAAFVLLLGTQVVLDVTDGPDHRLVGRDLRKGNMIVLLQVLHHELLYRIVELFVPVDLQPPPRNPE